MPYSCAHHFSYTNQKNHKRIIKQFENVVIYHLNRAHLNQNWQLWSIYYCITQPLTHIIPTVSFPQHQKYHMKLLDNIYSCNVFMLVLLYWHSNYYNINRIINTQKTHCLKHMQACPTTYIAAMYQCSYLIAYSYQSRKQKTDCS